MLEDNKLRIFERFSVDKELPKFQKPKGENVELVLADGSTDHAVIYEFAIDLVNRGWTEGIEITEAVADRITLRGRVKGFRGWLRKLLHWVTQRPSITIPQFFTLVKGSVKDLEIVEARAKGYEEAISNARKFGQKALVEELTQNLVAVRLEAHLVTMGLTKYLTEDKLVEFVKLCPKGLRLDWIANFGRRIPTELLERKLACDERFLFDNYVILHYDPKGKSWKETEAEKAARKDPILFGVMKGRRQLYYLGDWVDELCDLTLDQIADTIGKSAIGELK